MIHFYDEEESKEEPEKEASPLTAPAPQASATRPKIWFDIGNGKEALVKPISKPGSGKTGSSYAGKILINKKYSDVRAGEFIYYANKWVKVEEVKPPICVLKIGGKPVEIPISECVKEIPINILVCSTNRTYVYSMLTNGRKTLVQLGTKLAKHNGMNLCRTDWYYNGRKMHNETRVEGVNIKPTEKILCMLQEYEMKTFKRFKNIEESQGWYMSKDKSDAINVTPSQPVSLFGFGMYHCKEGALSYLLSYQVSLYDSVVKSDSILVTRVGSEQIFPIFFSSSKEPIFVDAGVKVSIVLQYFDYDDSSQLYKGGGGSDYDSIEGNEVGLFKIESHPESANGTTVGIGQIPELYYAKAG